MADINIKRGTATALTWTIDSLASSVTAGRQATAVDDTATKALDYLLTLHIVYPNSAPANDKSLYLYVAGFDGTNWSGGASGSDAAYTFDDITAHPTPLRGPQAMWMVQNKTRDFGPFSIASFFGGIVPIKWAPILINYSGQTLSTTCSATYQAITATVA